MFLKKIDERIKIVFLLLLLLFIFIILRVFYVQIIDYKKLNKYASELWSRDLPLEADRGLILDRNGVVLADNLTTTSLVLIPNQIKNKKKTTKLLAEILNVSYSDMKEHVYKKTSIERVHPEGRRLSYDIAEKISNLKLDGVYLVKESKRNYPYKNMLSHSLGYVGIDNQGLSGLELQYDKYLTGKSGAIKYFSDAKGNKLNLSDIYVEPQDGMNISLTIDINIQKSLERELDNIVDMFSPDMALAVVMDPNNGEILGMASRPDYDPNNYQEYSQEVLSRNLPIWASYEPGSTFKLITASAALEEGITTPDKEGEFCCTGGIEIAGVRIKCWRSYNPHGPESLRQALMNSCNPVFIGLGQKMGVSTYYKYLEKFGLLRKTGIDLPGEASSIFLKEEKVGPVELATISFGQRFEITPLQLVTAVSSIANGGMYVKPRIVKQIVDSETQEVRDIPVEKNTRVISEKTSKEVLSMMQSVVADGTGRNAQVKGYSIGGKTGTSEDGVNTNKYVTSFLGVAPISDPKVVILVTLYNPTGEGGHQGGAWFILALHDTKHSKSLLA